MTLLEASWGFKLSLSPFWASLVAQMTKNVLAVQESRVQSLGPEDPLEEGNGNPVQYSCLENFMDRGAWRAVVPGVKETQLQGLSTHVCLQVSLKNGRRRYLSVKNFFSNG